MQRGVSGGDEDWWDFEGGDQEDKGDKGDKEEALLYELEVGLIWFDLIYFSFFPTGCD